MLSTKLKEAAGNSSASTNFIEVLKSASGDESAQANCFDTVGNIYTTGYSTVASGYPIETVKYDASGAVQWQRKLNYGASDYNVGYGIAVGSSGAVYVSGTTYLAVIYYGYVAKYSSSGSLTWQRKLIDGAGTFGVMYSVVLDSSENIYGIGYFSPASNIMGSVLVKYNSSGTLQWQRKLSLPANNIYGYSIARDSSNNLYVGADSDLGVCIAKYNSSGTLQWQRILSGANTNYFAKPIKIAIDSSNNVYITGSGTSGSLYFVIVVKYNSSGTLQWQKKLTGSSSCTGDGIAIDSSDNVYICGSSNTTGTIDMLIAKYNSSGTLQWQRKLGSGNNDALGIAVSSAGIISVCGYQYLSSSYDIVLASLPSDGSKTGTYTVGAYTFTYASNSLTDGTPAFTDAAGSFVDAAGTLTDSAAILTDSASTLTSTVTSI